MSKIFQEIEQERARLEEHWTSLDELEPIQWVTLLGKEYGAVCKEAVDFNFCVLPKVIPPAYSRPDGFYRLQLSHLVAYRKELIELATIAVAMVESLDRKELPEYLEIIDNFRRRDLDKKG